MNALSLLCVTLVMLAVSVTSQRRDDVSRFENVNIEQILSSERILKNYLKCMLDMGPCTSEGKAFKRSLPQIVETGCNDCTPSQRRTMRRLSNFIRANKPQEWEKIVTKYNIVGRNKDNFDQFISENN